MDLSNMANVSNKRKETYLPSDKTASSEDILHPELLSRDFIQLVLRQRNITTAEDESRDRLTELYLRHVVPLPQRALPNSRWGRKMRPMRGRETLAGERSHGFSSDPGKRPPVVFDSRSSYSGPVRLKKQDESPGFRPGTDRLKPPPSLNLSNPVRKLTSTVSSSPSCSTTSSDHTSSTGNGSLASSSSSSSSLPLKREALGSGELTSPKVKKIQHVTWP